MKTYKHVYIAIDLHSKHSMIGYMNPEDSYFKFKYSSALFGNREIVDLREK